MIESETIEEYFNRITTIVNQLKMNEEQKIIEKILRIVTQKFITTCE